MLGFEVVELPVYFVVLSLFLMPLLILTVAMWRIPSPRKSLTLHLKRLPS